MPAHVVAAVGVLAILAITQQSLVRGTASPDNDALQFFGPYHMVVGNLARHGSLLLWNPLSNGGSPDYIEPQVGAISPAVLATGVAAGGAEWGFRLYWFLVWFAGGAGVVALGRHLRAPAWGCFCIATGYMLSGFYVGSAQHTAMLATASHLPWVLWRADVALTQRRPLAAAQAGGLLGLSGLGGYPGILVMNGMTCALWLVGRVITAPTARALRARQALASLAIIGIISLIVLSPTYLAFVFEGRGFTHRVGPLPRWVAVENNSLLPWNVATLAGPAALFWPLVPSQDASMRSLYLGVLVPAAAVVALRRSEHGWRMWLAVCAVFFIAAALGSTMPVRGWLYDFFPPTRYFRHASLFRVPAMLLISVLAMLGVRDLQGAGSMEDLRRIARAMAITAGVLCVVYGAIGSLAPDPKNWAWASTLALWAAAPLGVYLSTLVASTTRAVNIAAACLVTVASLDATVTARISAPQVYGRHIESWRTLDRLRQRTVTSMRLLDREARSLNNFNLVLGVSVLQSYAPLASPLYEALVSDPVLSTMAIGGDRFWFVSSPPPAPLSETFVSSLGASMRLLGTPVVAVHSPQAMLRGLDPRAGREAGDAPAPAQLIQPYILVYENNRLEFDVTAPRSGWVVVTDRWAPGWSAEVNGVPARVWGANTVFRAVQVKPGRNTVKMRYRPWGYPWLVAVSWGTIAIVFGLTVVPVRSFLRR